jgi:ATP-dependent exoDNAse (exonuclease V) alpha subunit
VITEGASLEKLARIRRNDYLARGLRSLANCQGSLFVHGHSLAENDRHVLRAVVEGKFKAIFVSIHGNSGDAETHQIQDRAASLAAERPAKKRLEVDFYDAESASVWS